MNKTTINRTKLFNNIKRIIKKYCVYNNYALPCIEYNYEGDDLFEIELVDNRLKFWSLGGCWFEEDAITDEALNEIHQSIYEHTLPKFERILAEDVARAKELWEKKINLLKTFSREIHK